MFLLCYGGAELGSDVRADFNLNEEKEILFLFLQVNEPGLSESSSLSLNISNKETQLRSDLGKFTEQL